MQTRQDDLRSTEDMQSVEVVDEEPGDDTNSGAITKKRKEKEPQHEREPGKSILPFSRVQKIIKADKVAVNVILPRWRIASCSISGTSNSRARRDFLDLTCHRGVHQKTFRGMPEARGAGEANDRTTEGCRYVWSLPCQYFIFQFHSLAASIVRRADEFMFLEGTFFSGLIISSFHSVACRDHRFSTHGTSTKTQT